MRTDYLFICLKSPNCTTIKQLQLVTLQRGFLHGAYSNHESLNWMQQKLKNNEHKLTDWTKSLKFMKEMVEVFTNYDVYSNDKIKRNNLIAKYAFEEK